MLSQPSKENKVATKTEKKVITTGVNTKILEKIRNDLKSILDDLQN